jgi:hypothetical protein
MDERALQITIGDSEIVYATTGPQDQDRLAEIFGNSPTVQLREAEGDVEGHGLSDEILVDVEGHAIALRLPTPADAAALRKALAATALTATLVTAGAIAALQSPAAPSANVVDTQTATRGNPAQAVRADEDQLAREQGYANAQAAAQAAAIAEARSEIPTAQDRANYGNSQAAASQASASDGDVVVPGPAQRADEAENLREQSNNPNK